MKVLMPSKTSALLAVLSATVVAATAPAAMAMPLVAVHGASNTAPLLQRTADDQHRSYPGANSAEAQKARSERNAPNMFCEKQENKCE